MTKKVLTTDALVKSVKRRMALPLDQNTFDKQDIIDILNEEMDLQMISFLLSSNQEFLVNHVEFLLSEATEFDNGFFFKIPDRAVGNKLRRVCYINDTGTQTPLARIEPDNIGYFEYVGNTNFSYYVENDMIKLLDKYSVANATRIRLYYEMSPSELVEDKFGAKIISLNTTTGEVVVDNIPDNFETGIAYDFINANSPNKCVAIDKIPTSINTTSKIMNFDPTVFPSDLKLGDYICVANESVVPQIPTELHPMLAQMAAVAILEAQGDEKGITIAAARLQKMSEGTKDLISNRVEGSNQKINNMKSPLSNTRGNIRRTRW
jgi:hypothetical protein